MRFHPPRRSSGRNAATTSASFFTLGDKRAVETALPELITVTRLKLVFNRVTAARWSRGAALANGMIGSAGSRFMSAPSARTLLAPTWAPHSPFPGNAAPCRRRRRVGGSFGMKGGHYPEYALALWASRKIGRPVKWIAERGEGMLTATTTATMSAKESWHSTATGFFLALRAHNVSNIGAYLATGRHHLADDAFGRPRRHLHDTGYLCRGLGGFHQHNEHRPLSRPGRPEASYIIERLIDNAARDMQIDRAELPPP